jgi:maltose-binding protein MalE
LAELAQLLQSFDTQWAASQATYRMVANSAARAQTLASKRPLITAVWQQYLQAVALPVSVDALFWSAMDQGMRQTLSGELQPQKAADLLRELLASQAYLPTSLTRDP